MLVRHIVRLFLVFEHVCAGGGGGVCVSIGRYRLFAWAIVVGIGVSVLMVHGRWTEVA